MPKHAAQGKRLRMAIERSGVERAILAERCGISVSYIARMIAGDRSGADHLPQMAEALGVQERWLRFGDVDARPSWALDPETLRALEGVSDYVAKPAQRSQPTKTDAILQVLQDLLAEQRRCRESLDRLVACSKGEGQLAGRVRFQVPPRPARSPA